jgi:hypothetical protein
MEEPMLPPAYHLDESDLLVLRRQDDPVVAAFSAQGRHHRVRLVRL